MAIRQIDGGLFKAMVAAAARSLNDSKEAVNALNVFPVPDGDTGSNMSLTMWSACREVERAPERSVGTVAQALAQGSLMGARGNSGVILSQLFRGFARSVGECQTVDARTWAAALKEGVDTAYKAVMKPVEGTILTVARESAAAAVQASRTREADVRGVMEACYQAALIALERTPDLLPVLKKAGVVDSGGKGLTLILYGYLEALRAADMGGAEAVAPSQAAVVEPAVSLPPPAAGAGAEGYRDNSPAAEVAFKLDDELYDLHFPYDTEFYIRGQGIDLEAVRMKLETLGDSVYVVGGPELAKVHIHTDNPGPVLDTCIRYGDLIRIEIHNMREQYEDIKARAGAVGADTAPVAPTTPATAAPEAPEEARLSAVVAVAVGEGVEAVFTSLGVARTVQGGQTMNPSTQDLLDAINACPTPVVFVLPNNKNIILAAEQAAALAEKQVYVVPARSIPQGIAALLSWQPNGDPDRNLQAMTRTLDQVQTGEITYAVRDTTFGDLQIKAGDMLGLWNGEIVTTGTSPEATLKDVLARMMERHGGEVITVYYGQGVEPEQAEALAAELQKLYRGCEVDLQYGGQPLYFYIFSLE